MIESSPAPKWIHEPRAGTVWFMRTKQTFRVFLGALALAALLPSTAWATCMTQCDALIVDDECTPYGPEVPFGASILVAASCETCCSPPGGPLDCSADAADPKQFAIWTKADAVLPGTFGLVDMMCEGSAAVMGFSPETWPIPNGSYQLLHTNMILGTFDVVPECIESTDCGACAVCVGGECKGMGDISCTDDDD